MLVQQILSMKASQGVMTVLPSTTICEAAKLLTEKHIGTVIVSTSGDTADGILSERDIVRELANTGSGCLDQPVSAYMTTKLQTCTLEERSDDILARMTEGRFRHMPVIENGKLVGLVSLGDVVKARLSQLAMEKDALEGMIMGH